MIRDPDEGRPRDEDPAGRSFDTSDDWMDLDAAVEVLGRATPLRPRILIVSGSGLGRVAEDLAGATFVPFRRLPGMPAAGVAGHEGRLIAGRLDGVPVWVQAGRLHLYEGHPVSRVTVPMRMAAKLGVEVAILTNAAGGIRWDLGAGSLVLLVDLLNLSFREPRVGRARSAVFDAALRELALETARARKIRLSSGTYAGVLGPSFETPAEIRMIARLGGDVVGMSTVAEVRAARALGLRVLGISLVTNRAAGLRRGSLSHEEVVRAAEERSPVLAELIREIVRAEGTADRRSG